MLVTIFNNEDIIFELDDLEKGIIVSEYARTLHPYIAILTASECFNELERKCPVKEKCSVAMECVRGKLPDIDHGSDLPRTYVLQNY